MIEIAGHADVEGSEAANLVLSEGRARAVADCFAARGMAADRFRPVGHGESQPVADNDSAAGKAQNRRIAFRVIDG